MGVLRIALLGKLEIQRYGAPVAGLTSTKAQALLCYLAVTGRPHLRPTLAGLLWGELPEASAQNNLRKALTNLRQLVGPYLSITRQAVAFNRDSRYWLDVEVLQAQVGGAATGAASRRADIERLQGAVELYRGGFLEGFYVRQAPAFEEWVLAQRLRLRGLVLQALHTLTVCHAEQGEAGLAAAIDYATRLLALEPWREEAHQQLMVLLARSGQRAAALVQYETCRQVLAEELGVEPGAETTALYNRIRDGELGRGAEHVVSQPKRVQESVRLHSDTPFGLGRGVSGTNGPEMELPPALPDFLSSARVHPNTPVPFVARERELGQLDSFLEKALAQRGQVVFITGEAGIGKTTLVQEFTRRAQERYVDLIVARGNCNSYTGFGDPYLPFREILGMVTGDVEAPLTSGAISLEQALRLWNLIPRAVQLLVKISPDLINIFIASPALSARGEIAAPCGAGWLDQLQALLANIKPGEGRANLKQADLFEQYTKVLVALARQHPLLLVVDDLQWADAGSINLLFHLGKRLQGSRILVVGIYRPVEVALGRESASALPTAAGQHERHPLAPVVNEFQRHFGQIEVGLQSADRQFVDAFLDTEPNRLGAEFRRSLYQQTKGHPLFTVEILRGMQERGDLVQDEAGRWIEGPAVDWDTLPARVEGIIVERFSRLPLALQETLKVASVEGEDFTAEIVAQVRSTGEPEIVAHLSSALDKQHQLVRSQGSQRLEPGGQRVSRYRFRHILLQKHIYNSLDDAECVYLHEAVGKRLEGLYAGQSGPAAIQLARHFQAAGLELKAIGYLQQAGEHAVSSYAYQEAIVIFDKALALLKTLPESSERTQRELMLQLARGNALTIASGFGARDVREAYTRARELCRQTSAGETPHLFPALFGLWIYYFTRAEHQVARELSEQLLQLAEQARDADLRLQAHHALWTSLFAVGEFAKADNHVNQGLLLYAPQQHSSHASRYAGHDAKVCGLSWAGPVLWCLGYPDQALQKNLKALAYARELSHPVSVVQAHKWLATLYQLRREQSAVFKHAEADLTIAAEQGFLLFVGWARSLRGWALAQQGQGNAGIAQIRKALDAYQATGAEFDRPQMLALLAEAYQTVGQIAEGLGAVDEALAIAHETGERYYKAELHRLKGELWLARRAGAEIDEVDASYSNAEACFQRAIAVARPQNARSLELRAVMSLCRLWHRFHSPDKRTQAHQMLAEIYGWFTEGFDTANLKEAKGCTNDLFLMMR